MKNILTLLFVFTFYHSFAQSDTVISKTIVDPTAMVAGSFGGTIQATTFKVAKKIDVKAADTSASVTSYTIYFQGTGFETAPGMLENIKGNLFTKDVVRLLAKCVPGTTVTIDDIKVMSGGVIKKVPSLHFILQ
ncbi:GldM family protein [Lacibacter sp. H407]|uniref:GldM family protein n=1 Tax=Lacibacter sp. H407 TaxID=3133423 RepID=UPI0030C26B43